MTQALYAHMNNKIIKKRKSVAINTYYSFAIFLISGIVMPPALVSYVFYFCFVLFCLIVWICSELLN
jgi:hypothetical protein